MPYTDKVRARETAKRRMQKFRERQKKGGGVTAAPEKDVGVTVNEAGVTWAISDGMKRANDTKRWKEYNEV